VRRDLGFGKAGTLHRANRLGISAIVLLLQTGIFLFGSEIKILRSIRVDLQVNPSRSSGFHNGPASRQ
jgi:hypothetical protein